MSFAHIAANLNQNQSQSQPWNKVGKNKAILHQIGDSNLNTTSHSEIKWSDQEDLPHLPLLHESTKEH
jgi:hypothetical protein